MKAILRAAVILFAVGICGCGGDGSGDATPGGDRSSIVKVSEAQEQILKTHPQAIIVWAGGRRQNQHPMSQPQETEIWDFMAVAPEPDAESWDMSFADSSWTVTPRPQPPFEIVFLDLTGVWMDVDAAWELVQMSGINQSFRTWELFQDLNPAFEHPTFAFSLLDGRYLLVDTVTGEILEGLASKGY